jgi:hypothetical protein
MKIKIQTISAPAAAYMCHTELGWDIRKTTLKGLRLMPCARHQDGTAYRPVYNVADVREFIRKVKTLIPSAGRSPIRATVLEIDSSLSWRLNKFDRYGSPVVTTPSGHTVSELLKLAKKVGTSRLIH